MDAPIPPLPSGPYVSKREPIPPESYRIRLGTFLARPETMDEIFAHLANGGSLLTYAKNNDFRFSDIGNYVHSDPARLKMYGEATDLGDQWHTQRVIDELQHIAFSDIRECYNADGSIKSPTQWPESVARALSAFELEELFANDNDERIMIGYAKKIKMYDKIKALELIGKEKGMFVNKLKVEGSLKLEDLVGGSFDKGEI